MYSSVAPTCLRVAIPLLWTVLAALACSSGSMAAQVLKYSVTGVEGELKDNVEAWLGEPPETESGRENFVSSAGDKTRDALRALGYYRAEVSVDVASKKKGIGGSKGSGKGSVWQVRIAVVANEPVRIRKLDVRVIGAAAEVPIFAEILAELPFATTEVFNHGTYQDLKSELISAGQKQGYFDGQFTRNRVEIDVAANAADVALYYDPGQRYKFGAMQFDQAQISREQLSVMSSFEAGDDFDLAKLQGLQGDLQQTGYYSSVLLRPEFNNAEGGLVPVSLALAPAKRHSFNLGLGYRTDTEERVSLTWRTPRINAAGHSQETRLEYSAINPSGRITYHIPLTHPLNDVLHLTARVEDNEFGDIDSRQTELGVRREFRRNKWVDSYLVRALNETWDVADQSRDNTYLLPGFTLSRRDLSGSLVDPASGFSQFYRVEAGSEQLGSDIDLLRAYARFGGITTLAPRHRLVGRLELGTALVADSDRAQLAPSLNFFAGGAQSLRGFDFQSIGNEIEVENDDGSISTIVVGGDKLAVASMEYQYDYNDRWRLALFSDFGDAFDTGEFESHYSLGFGLHFITLVGAIKAQIAYPLSEEDPAWRFHLDIGAQF